MIYLIKWFCLQAELWLQCCFSVAESDRFLAELLNGDVRSGEVLTIDSDKFEEIKWDEVPKYWSKKTKSYRPVKEKDMETVYVEIEGRNYNDFVLLGDVLNES